MFDECSFRRNKPDRKLVFKCRCTLTCRRISVFFILILLIGVLWLSWTSSSFNSLIGYRMNTHFQSSVPTLARTLYLFICENQAEVDAYAPMFPSVSADAIFYCWQENCNASRFRSSIDLYINTWSSETKRNEKLVSLESISSFYSIKSRVFIINEKQLNITEKLTWTTARNTLYEFSLNEEGKQGWSWSFYIFADGDVHTACPIADQLLTNKTIVDYGRNEEYLFASHFYSFINLTKISSRPEEKCFLLFFSLRLSIISMQCLTPSITMLYHFFCPIVQDTMHEVGGLVKRYLSIVHYVSMVIRFHSMVFTSFSRHIAYIRVLAIHGRWMMI